MALELLMQEARDLSEEALMEVVRFVRFIKVENSSSHNPGLEMNDVSAKKVRTAGMYKGKIWMADDFDSPLEEFKEYM